MTTRSRILLVLASLLLLLAYVLPIWRVSLEAPQYPQGIGMQIRINTISGVNPHDLQNINGLNHYIGMQEIVPESIPELKIMPWLFGFLIAMGLLSAALGKRPLLYLWTGLFTLLLAVGFVDYYKWGYDYGHNLNPEAAIKIPGMAYQPPLIGSKDMLNFVAHSWPDTGGLAVFAALLLGIVATVVELRRRRRAKAEASQLTDAAQPAKVAVAGVLLIGMLAGCSPEPQPLVIGETPCSHCRMTVSDDRFGAELVSTTGKVYPFDAIECMTAYLSDEGEGTNNAFSFWVTPFDAPGTLVDANQAYFLRSNSIQSPMGSGLAAYSSLESRDAAAAENDGLILNWEGVLALAERDLAESHPAHGH